MSDAKIYKYYMYLAGVKVPLLNCVISSQIGSLAQLSISLHYSPFITQLYYFTKIQIYEQITDNGVQQEPTLEFDGVVISITRSKNILGAVRCSLVCLTDGMIWNRCKQYDIYLNNITQNNSIGTGDVVRVRADGMITNFYTETLTNNNFDIGCAVGSILTSVLSGSVFKDALKTQTRIEGNTYTYNGKVFTKKAENATGTSTATPQYYVKFLHDYKLGNKLYGIATSQRIKEYFHADRIVKLLNNQVQDIQGENTFWTIALQVMQYGFYSVYDIPNPTYIPSDVGSIADIEVGNGKELSGDYPNTKGDKDPSEYTHFGKYQDKIKVTASNKKQAGLAEYILKPISVLGIPFACNIIWPDQVLEENITYDFFNAPTRVIMKSSPIPDGVNSVLCSQVFAGPIFKDDESYLQSFTPEKTTYNASDAQYNIRQDIHMSDFEKFYGINYHRLELSYAFDNALLQKNLKGQPDDNNDTKKTIKLVNNFLNYEFAQKYYSSRQYSIQVTPDVNVVIGLPLIIMERTGQHVIAFCTGQRKSWDTNGNKTVVLSVMYPRYYYENIGELGNIVDPTSSDENSLNELKTLIGSEPLLKHGSGTKEVMNKVEDLYKEFLQDPTPNKTKIKDKYKRTKICTFNQFMSLHNENHEKVDNLPDYYSNGLFNSTDEEDKLSNHYFRVTDSKGKTTEYGENINLRGIINKHNEWIKEGQRI